MIEQALKYSIISTVTEKAVRYFSLIDYQKSHMQLVFGYQYQYFLVNSDSILMINGKEEDSITK
jgi:hypothetical protein